ncbi:putative transport protein [Clostridium bornimense]|uniref:Putative transport protein n=1 Tax=Clostridium bornimense TaxID=1216932 RepID=W6SJT3_9CLOT|nr:MFS transporter [Clostridium bornimense]CDM69965.1 putative transport protein [Clostridium bornimense]
MNNKLKRNVNIDYIYCFIKNFDISSAIWVLYMVHKGLPLWQIGIVEGIFHIASFLFEVPSGALADLFGRKNVIIVGRLCSAISAVINLVSNNILGFSIGFTISALSYNLNSGSEEALVYDSLKKIGEEKSYLKVNSRLNLIIEISQGLATFIGGILAEYSYVYCYITVIIISLLSMIPAMLFKEVPMDREDNNDKVSIKKHFKVCYDIIKDNKEILKNLIYFPVIFTFDTIVFFYGQQYFSELGLNKIEISIVMLFSGIFSCVGSITCEKVIAVFKENTKYAISILMGVSIVMISSKNIVISIIFFAIMNYANSVLYPIQSASLNKLIPSEQRATIISIDSMIFSFTMVCLFPVCGLLGDVFNLHITFFILGIIQVILIVLLINRKNK